MMLVNTLETVDPMSLKLIVSSAPLINSAIDFPSIPNSLLSRTLFMLDTVLLISSPILLPISSHGCSVNHSCASLIAPLKKSPIAFPIFSASSPFIKPITKSNSDVTFRTNNLPQVSKSIISMALFKAEATLLPNSWKSISFSV